MMTRKKVKMKSNTVRTLTLALLGAALVLLVGFTAKAETLELNSENTIILRGPITEASATQLQMKLHEMDAKRGVFGRYPLYLVLDSPGGSIDAGNDVIEATKSIPNLHTVTLFAASMASAIVEQVSGTRYVNGSSILMFHRAKGGVSGQFNDGELETRLGLYKRIVTNMEVKNSSRMKISLADYKAKVKDELWIYGQENIDQYSADKMVSIKCSNELVSKKETVLVETMFGSGKLIFSSCPLFRMPLGGADEESKALLKNYKTEILKNFSVGYRF
jgi:ATP-dependent protease ClpP protease subunit